MCATNFTYVKIGDERMILCRDIDYDEWKIKGIIKKTFPELFKRVLFFRVPVEEFRVRAEGCRKMYSSHFDVQVYPLEEENDWDKQPFMALWVFEKDGVTYCGAKCATIPRISFVSR